LVSIIIPCYKMGRYVGEALGSIGAQSFSNWEVLAVDDCGPEDGTRGAIEDFAARHPHHRVEYTRHPVNLGVSAARNSAVSHARGKFVAFLDPDDFWGANYLESQLEALRSNPTFDVSYTGAVRVDVTGRPLGEILSPTQVELDDWPHSLFRRNFMIPSSVVVLRCAVTELQGFDEAVDLQHVEDWDLWLRLAEAGRGFRFNGEAVAFYREHSGAATQQNDRMIRRVIALRTKHLTSPGFREYMAAYVTELERENARQKARLTKPWYLGWWRLAAKITPKPVKEVFRKVILGRRPVTPEA